MDLDWPGVKDERDFFHTSVVLKIKYMQDLLLLPFKYYCTLGI